MDKVTLSPQVNGDVEDSLSSENDALQGKAPGEQGLNTAELAQLRELKSRDTEVRNHEQAHIAAAGQYAASGASFSYQLGPDGKRYAIGGEVEIDISKEDNPEATLQKMEVVARAALAPASPSAADRQIAARAALTAAEARQEIAMQRTAEGTAPAMGESENTNDTITALAGQEDRSSRQSITGVSSARLKLAIDSYRAIQAMA